MTSAPMPNPPGGKLICPAGTDPWIEVDIRSGKINAECKAGPTPNNPLVYERWILNNIKPNDRPKTDDEKRVFQKSLKLGTYTTTNKIYIFSKDSDIGDDNESGAITAGR